MNPYKNFVEAHALLATEGKSFPLGGFPDCPRPDIAPDAPKVLVFAPHPDDEVIIGGLALRLMRQCGWRVVNVAVTQGSNKARQAERLKELQACCQCIGFDLQTTVPGGLEKVNVQTRQDSPALWEANVKVIAEILQKHQPKVILFPHVLDWNSSHIGTHHLVMDALKTLDGFACHLVETEFWGQMPSPNLMVEVTSTDLADLITALTFHVGEVKRNPYHLTLPAWMIDNVRRGGELVGGQGGAAPGFTFATLYRLGRWVDGALEHTPRKGQFLPASGNPSSLFA